MVRRMVVATVAALQARAGGGEGSALILAGYDPVLVVRPSGRRMNPSTEDRRRDGAPSQPAGTGSDALVREGNGGEIARSVRAEIRVQSGHGGTWIASSVPAEIRARAQTAYKEASAAAPLTMLAEPYPWRAEPVHSSAHTRAYRAYLGASPAAGDPTATPRAAAGSNCEGCWFYSGEAIHAELFGPDSLTCCPPNELCPGCKGYQSVVHEYCADESFCGKGAVQYVCRERYIYTQHCCDCVDACCGSECCPLPPCPHCERIRP
jgi:hypothetical protein